MAPKMLLRTMRRIARRVAGLDLKILIVDDEADLVETCVRLLRGLGFLCIAADSGPRAIALMQSEKPDLVVTDLSLPIGDGFQVSRHALTHSPAIPVIIITAYNSTENIERARMLGVSDYLAKPVSNGDLTQAVRKVLHPWSNHF